MSSSRHEYDTIRKYLLGQLAGADHEEFEQRFFTDDELFKELQAAEDDLIDDFLTGDLSEADVVMFHQKFLVGAERKQKLRIVQAWRNYAAAHAGEKPPKKIEPVPAWRWQQLFSTPPLRIAVFAAVILIAAVGVWRIYFFQSDVDKGLLALNSAYRDQRPIESRITQLSHAPFLTTRGPGASQVNESELRRAELILDNEVNEKPTPAAHHALGKVYLAKKEFDEAIEQFEEALKGDPNNAQIYADLGAAHLEKGKIDQGGSQPGQGLEELARGLDTLNRALALDDSLLEARFNRALIYQYMSLPEQGATEWREYLKRDSNSHWAEEAARSLKVLEDRKHKSTQTTQQQLQSFLKAYELRDDETAWLTISRHRDLSAGTIQNALVDEYLESSMAGESIEASRTLDKLLYVAELERKRAGDLYVSDLCDFLRSLAPTRWHSLIEARKLMRLGREDLIRSQPEAATLKYIKAKELFDQIGDTTEAVYVEYPLGHSYLLQSKSELSLATFERVIRQSGMHEYNWLLAQALTATANVEIGLSNYSAALDFSERSLKVSADIDDTTGVVKTTNQLAHQYFRLGNYSKSLDLHQQSLSLANEYSPEPLQNWRNYFSIAMPLNAMGLQSAAIEYEKEALRQAQELAMPQIICRSHTILGQMLGSQRNYGEAIRNVAMALELAQKIPSETARKESTAYSSLQLGLLHRQTGDFAKSVASYDDAIRLYGELDNLQAFSYVAHKGKLLSCLSHGACVSVQQEIATCLDLFERYRFKIREESNRDSFFDTEQNIYDVVTEFEFSNENFQTAFEYSERGRARSLLDLVNNEASLIGGSNAPDVRFNSATPAMNLEELRAGMPEKVQLLQYALLEDKLLIWMVSKDGFASAEKQITLVELNDKVRHYIGLISNPTANYAEQLRREGMELYEILIGPIAASLDQGKLLCVIPDKILTGLPFSALISPDSREYLIQRYVMTTAPSATSFVLCSELARKKERTSGERLLAVGNPSFDRKLFPELADLPSAAKEAREIAAYYQPSRAIIGEAATKGLIEKEMKESGVVHLALHSVLDEKSPMRSRLLLANPRPDTQFKGSNGILQAYKIYGLRLPLTRLVILSACQTGSGRYYRGEGVMGLSRTFIASGVPLVISSLWSVESDSTATLMIDFHKHRKVEKLSSADALRAAQLEMIGRSDKRYQHPYFWAAFTLVGGYATF